MLAAAKKSFGNYFVFAESDMPEPKLRPCVIDVDEFRNIEAWEAKIKRFQSGNRTRAVKKARSLGYQVKTYNWQLHIPDAHEINTSMPVRSGGQMRGSYLKSVEEMGGPPSEYLAPVAARSKLHWSQTFGVFKPLPGHKQGDVEVNEKLFGYISLRRFGDFACYSTFLGHGDHLNDGIMILMHHEIAAWLGNKDNELAEGLRYLMYGAVVSGGAGLQQWKRRGGFYGVDMDVFVGDVPGGPRKGKTVDIPGE
jgi:hypothetical protein